DPAVLKAQEAYEAAVAKADAQVEAMVYTKHHNPITGTDEYTRLPAGSTIGFGTDTERVPVQSQPPTQGEVPVGTPAEAGGWESRYSQGQRASDRAIIDSGINQMMMPENQRAFDDLTQQAQGITERLDNAANNEARLKELDDAA